MRDEQVVRTPRVQITSLMASGMPASGPSGWLSRRWVSRRSASRSACSSVVVTNARTLPSTWAMRSRWARVSSTDESSRRRRRSDASEMLSCHNSATSVTPCFLSQYALPHVLFLVVQHSAHATIGCLMRWRGLDQPLGIVPLVGLVLPHDVFQWEDMGGGGHLAGVGLGDHVDMLQDGRHLAPHLLALGIREGEASQRRDMVYGLLVNVHFSILVCQAISGGW